MEPPRYEVWHGVTERQLGMRRYVEYRDVTRHASLEEASRVAMAEPGALVFDTETGEVLKVKMAA